MEAKGNKLLPVYKAVGGVAGLHLQLTPGDGKSWIFRYAVEAGADKQGNKKYKRRSLGLPGMEMTTEKTIINILTKARPRK